VKIPKIYLLTNWPLCKQDYIERRIFSFFLFYVRYLTLLHLPPLRFTVSGDASGIDPRTFATLTLTARRSNHSARSHPYNRLDLIHIRLDLIHIQLDLIHIRLDLIRSRLDLIHIRLDLILSGLIICFLLFIEAQKIRKIPLVPCVQ
jgi:hypothetical protein